MTGAIVIPASGETMDPVAAAREVAAGRGGLALCALGGGAIAGLAIALETWGGVPILVAGPAAVAGVAGGLVWLDGALARRGIRRSPLLGGEVRLSLGADGVRWRAERAEQEVAWDVLSDAFAVNGDLVLLARTGGFLGVPGSAGLRRRGGRRRGGGPR